MKTFVGMSAFFLIVSVIVAGATEVKPDAINSASLSTIPAERASKSSADPDPAIVRLQVLLDRAGASVPSDGLRLVRIAEGQFRLFLSEWVECRSAAKNDGTGAAGGGPLCRHHFSA